MFSGPMDVENERWRHLSDAPFSNVVARGDGQRDYHRVGSRQNPEMLRVPCVLPRSIAIVFWQWRYRSVSFLEIWRPPLKQAWKNGGADRIEADSSLGLNMETHEDGPVARLGRV